MLNEPNNDASVDDLKDAAHHQTKTKFQCFDCHKIFTEDEMKQEIVPSNFQVMGSTSDKTGMVDKCPHCGAVAFLGFNIIK